MKCSKCKTKNITKANYCKKCGNKFTKKEQEKAKRKTLIGKVEFLEDLYSKCTLKIITGHIVFKICSILIILGIGISIWINKGLDLKLLNSEDYEILYNKTEKEYYLITTNEKVLLNLYVPNRTKEIKISHYDSNANLLEDKSYKPDAEIILETKETEYYILDVKYLHDDRYSFKFYVLSSK